MQPVLILELLILISVANGTPVLAKKILGDVLSYPIDGGALLPDGRPLFGPSKTIRGLVLSFLITPLAAVFLGFPWQLGLLIAGAVIAGDLLSSFVKRRIGLSPSSRAIGLDQIPESLFPLLASRWLLPVTFLDVVIGVAIFWAAAPILSRLFFHLRLRDQPY
jgi:CDP-2,3-bis-(O-geranylgeranyl)-sn-glycerol synthase